MIPGRRLLAGLLSQLTFLGGLAVSCTFASGIYVHENGNVGMGTNSPEATLEIETQDTAEHLMPLRIEQNDTIQWAQKIKSRGWGLTIGLTADAQGTPFSIRKDGNDIMKVTNSGNVGIGKDNPSAGLHVFKTVTNDWTCIIQNYDGAGQGLSVLAGDGGQGTQPVFQVADRANTTSYLMVREDGRTGIGTANPSYKLDVNGAIRGSKVKKRGQVSN